MIFVHSLSGVDRLPLRLHFRLGLAVCDFDYGLVLWYSLSLRCHRLDLIPIFDIYDSPILKCSRLAELLGQVELR